MSEITSNSELTTKEIVEQAISDYHMSILPYLAKGNNGTNDTPLGAVQFFDDDTAPSGWLVADGTIYNISDYPFLASHYERVHGSKNYWGGNGTTTFAVPDWQGEFLRASGTNSHTNQGSGAAVGEHQDGTDESLVVSSGTNGWIAKASLIDANKMDRVIPSQVGRIQVSGTEQATSSASIYTSRPTNTSLLLCIKAVPAGHNYSTEEQVIGTWIDRKPIYQKTIDISTLTVAGAQQVNTAQTLAHNITNVDKIIRSYGVKIHTTGASQSFPGEGKNGPYDSGAMLLVNKTNIIYITSDADTSYTQGYVTIQYTKTTD